MDKGSYDELKVSSYQREARRTVVKTNRTIKDAERNKKKIHIFLRNSGKIKIIEPWIYFRVLKCDMIIVRLDTTFFPYISMQVSSDGSGSPPKGRGMLVCEQKKRGSIINLFLIFSLFFFFFLTHN